jgi:hypothetical protein
MTPLSFELERYDWSDLRSASGSSVSLKVALLDLSQATDAEQAREAYWRIENTAFVQGTLYPVCVELTRVLMAMISSNGRSFFSLAAALELIFQIVNADRHDAMSDVLGDSCRDVVRSGLWCLYRLATTENQPGAVDVLECVERDELRLESLRRMVESG